MALGLSMNTVHADNPTVFRLKVSNPYFYQTMLQQKTPVWCEFLSEGIDICLLKVQQNQIHLIPMSDRPQGDWKTMVPPVSLLTKERFVQQSIQGTTLSYWASGRMDGLDGLGWLYPEALKAMIGTDVLVAQPMPGAFFVWSKDSMDANKIMAISIKELYSTAEEPVSPYIYHWSKDAWRVWGEAVKKSSSP